MHHKPFGGRALSGCAGGAYSAPPDPLAGFKGPTSKGNGEEGRSGRERKGKEGVGEKGEGKWGREGKGSYRYFFFPTSSPGNQPPRLTQPSIPPG